MDGKTYYTFKAPKESVRFFALETDYLTPAQTAVVREGAGERGRRLEDPLLPSPALLVRRAPRFALGSARRCSSRCSSSDGVSVVFAGHDHFYERIKPQKGITYFVTGSGGKLRRGDIDKSTGLTAVRLRHRSGISRGGNRRRRLFFNAISQDRGGHRLRRHRAAEAGIGSFRLLLRARAARCSAQSCSKTAMHLLRRLACRDDDADFAAAVELQLAQALAADEGRRAVADDGADVQAQAGQRAGRRRRRSPLSILPMTRISTPALRALGQQRAAPCGRRS